MFFFLSKFLPLFVYPVGLVCLLLLLALFLRHYPRLQTAVLLFAVLYLYLAATPWVSLRLAQTLEWRYLPPDPLPSADVILLLGGATDFDGYPQTTVALNERADRIWYAAWLYHQGAADKLLLSGGLLPGNGRSEANRMADALSLMGVPPTAVYLEEASRNTYENARFSQPILEENGLETILLVTSALHMPRSVAIFEKQGMAVIPAPTDYESVQSQPNQQGEQLFTLLHILPDATSLKRTTLVLKEYIGLLVYRMQGWL